MAIVTTTCPTCRGKGHIWHSPEKPCYGCKGEKTVTTDTEKLSENMRRILDLLAHADKPMTGNQIGYALGLKPGRRQRGPWSGPTGVALRATPAITALRRRGLIRQARRPDGLSGTADVITEAGAKVVEAL